MIQILLYVNKETVDEAKIIVINYLKENIEDFDESKIKIYSDYYRRQNFCWSLDLPMNNFAIKLIVHYNEINITGCFTGDKNPLGLKIFSLNRNGFENYMKEKGIYVYDEENYDFRPIRNEWFDKIRNDMEKERICTFSQI